MHVEEVAFLACGWPQASARTHGTSIALRTTEGIVLVDAGGDVAKGLMAAWGVEGPDRIYLTHEHPDHTWGLPGLLHSMRFGRRADPLPIHGPAPAIERVQGAIDALGVTTPFELLWQPIDVREGQDARARWAVCDHPVPTLAYRFGDVVVCGDTGPAKDITRLAQGASLLIHEATHTDAERCHAHGHATPADAGAVAADARVGTLALIHRHPTLTREAAVAAAAFRATHVPIDGDRLVRDGGAWTRSEEP